MAIKKLLCSLLLLFLPMQAAGDCKKIDSCSCQLDSGVVIDLKDVGHNDGTPRFLDQKDPNSDYYYSYNPCYDFSESGDCVNVASCQKTSPDVGATYYDLGDQTSAEFIMEGNDIILQYTGQGIVDPTLRTSKVKLVCSDSGDMLVVHGELQETIYSFDLVSPHCCTGSEAAGGLSVGSILLITALVLVIVYVIGGILFMKFVKHEEGSNIIPNKGFWVTLPGYIKDGALFVATPCRQKKTSYNEI